MFLHSFIFLDLSLDTHIYVPNHSYVEDTYLCCAALMFTLNGNTITSFEDIRIDMDVPPEAGSSSTTSKYALPLAFNGKKMTRCAPDIIGVDKNGRNLTQQYKTADEKQSILLTLSWPNGLCFVLFESFVQREGGGVFRWGVFKCNGGMEKRFACRQM